VPGERRRRGERGEEPFRCAGAALHVHVLHGAAWSPLAQTLKQPSASAAAAPENHRYSGRCCVQGALYSTLEPRSWTRHAILRAACTFAAASAAPPREAGQEDTVFAWRNLNIVSQPPREGSEVRSVLLCCQPNLEKVFQLTSANNCRVTMTTSGGMRAAHRIR
jgi:hypothetical protein